MDGLFRPWCKLQGRHLNSQKWKWHVRTSKCAIQSILFTFEQLLKAQRSRETKRTRLAKANSWWCLRMITPFGTYRSARLSFWNITAYLDWHMILFMFPFPCFLLQGFTFDWRFALRSWWCPAPPELSSQSIQHGTSGVPDNSLGITRKLNIMNQDHVIPATFMHLV